MLSKLKPWTAAMLLAALLSTNSLSQAIDILPLNQVSPVVERWGWDVKAWPTRLDTLSEASFLYSDDVPANLLRVPVFANAHSPDGSIDASQYSTEITAMRQVQRANPDAEIFASLKLQGANTYPDWLGDGTAAWPQSNGTIFSNVVERPNPELYSSLLADYVEHLQGFRVKIDYLGINNETDGALGVDRYIDTIDRLEAELISRGVPEEYRSFQYVGPDSFGLNTAENIAADIASRGRLDTMDIVGSHFYPQHGSGNEQSWTDIAAITGGAPMWHTEVHMPVGASQYVDDRQQAYRDTLSVLFASNKRGVDSFVWWDSGDQVDQVNDTMKRELVKTMTGGHAVETTPGFTAKNDPNDVPLYQAYVNGDTMTLWIANPTEGIDVLPVDLGSATVLDTPTSTYWEGNSLAITALNSGSLLVQVGSEGDTLRLRDVPADSTMFVRFRFALGEGDYDRDGDVDVADYELWEGAFGSITDLMADGNNDGIVNAADYTIWRDAFDAATVAIPEPTAISLVMILASLFGTTRSLSARA